MQEFLLKATSRYYLLGGIVGLVVGLMFSKIYQIWAIAYQVSHLDPAMPTAWGQYEQPLWALATEHPRTFTWVVVLLFIGLGMVFVNILLRSESSSE